MMRKKISEIAEEIARKFKIIGRRKELEAILLAKKAGKPVLIEGPVGVGKTTLAKAVAQYFQQDFIRVDGDERFDEYKLVGYFEPQLVLKVGWTWDAFYPGPLVRAMLNGGILFINEINRLSEGAQNVLIPALDEKIIEIPKLGELRAKDGFWVIATLNPEEYVGVTPLGEALKDRFMWIKLDYQSSDEEVAIVKLHTSVDNDIAKLTVAITRATRRHPEIKRGASVRGAIDLASLIKLHGENVDSLDDLVNLSLIALGTKIELVEGTNKSIEDVIREIVEEIASSFDFFRGREEKSRSKLRKSTTAESLPDTVPSKVHRDNIFDIENFSRVIDSSLNEKSIENISDSYSNQRTLLIFYPQSDKLLNIFRGMLGYFGSRLITDIREGRDIRAILSQLWRPLDHESIYLLGLEAVKYKNFAALTALAEMNPYAIARVIEEYISEIEGEDNIFLVHLFYLTKDYLSRLKKRIFKRLAKRIIMKKALRLIGRHPMKSGTLRKRVSYRPSLDFDLETTMENMLDKILLGIIDKKDIVCLERRDKRSVGAIILDVSGSMYGEKNVLASVISAMTIYALSPSDEFSIILFADHPYVIKRMHEKKRVEKLIEEIFNIRPLGYTNISAALKQALRELKKSRTRSRKWALLITDGEYNRGENPLKWASKFRKLHVIQLGGGSRGTQVCRALAYGRGKYVLVNNVEELLNAVRRVLKYPDK